MTVIFWLYVFRVGHLYSHYKVTHRCHCRALTQITRLSTLRSFRVRHTALSWVIQRQIKPKRWCWNRKADPVQQQMFRQTFQTNEDFGRTRDRNSKTKTLVIESSLLGRRTQNPSSSVLCSVYCALCIVHCALCTVHCVLCIVYCALCTVHCVLCIVYCALCTVHCVLCIVYCALCTVNCALCSVYCALYTVHCVLCIVYCALC